MCCKAMYKGESQQQVERKKISLRGIGSETSFTVPG